jgi:HK97 family phage major capsid protein
MSINNLAQREPEAIKKADLRLSNILDPLGELVPAQANNFVRLMQKESVLLGAANVEVLRAKKQRVNKVRFAQRILRRGVEGQALSQADRSAPDFTVAEFDTQLMKAEVNLTQEVLEDNIEGDRFISTLLELMSGAIARDLEDVVVNGDTSIVDPTNLLGTFDGMLVSATTNVTNALGSVFDQNVANAMIQTMPVEFRKNRAAQRFMTDHNSDQNARNTQATRATELGDDQLTNYNAVRWHGINLMPIDVWPSNLGGGLDETNVILTALQNVGVGIWRRFKITREVDNRADTVSWIASVRADFKYIEETAVVKAIQVQSL